LRGKEKDRKAGEILDEINSLVSEGVLEVMLLGQNVNSYGVEFGDKLAFGKLLRACGAIEGLERVRFISPHPKDFTDDVIDAMAETPNVMPHLHMPLQSGSDKILASMKRSYRTSKYLGILERVREKIPDAAITTDIIVGFPGESEEDFEDTINLVKKARFATAFTYQYSKRPGTPAADMPNQISPEIISDRYNRLTEVVNQVMLEENQKQIGKKVEVLVTNHEGKKDEVNSKLSGRAKDNRLVHFNFESEENIRPGDIVDVEITSVAPFFLLSDKPVLKIRKTKAGDLFEQEKNTKNSSEVLLGIPTLVRS
jgi:tRNA-2-methylthio-N6-dimethylallyladenosine synthase